MTAPAPYLSIVLTGRNDDYGGDFNARFFRALRFNHEHLTGRGVSLEIVFVEWNPVASKPYLADVLAAELPQIAATSLVAYLVDARYQAESCLNPRLGYLEFLAKNVGIRRARGRFVLSTNTDVFLGPGLIDVLARGELETGTVYRTNRIDVKLGVDESHITWDLLADPGNHVPRPPITPPLYAGATGDFVLLDRESFHRLRGFNEVYRLARVGVDHNFLVKACSSGCAITDIGAPVYHFSHLGSFQLSKHLLDQDLAQARWGNWQWHSHDVIYSNPESWGLRDAPERPLRPGVWHIAFDWSAVPPLVDLHRIVLPGARPGPAGA